MFLKADDLLLLSLPQKMFFILDVVQGPFFVQIVPPQKKKTKKKQFLRVTNFSELMDCNTNY